MKVVSDEGKKEIEALIPKVFFILCDVVISFFNYLPVLKTSLHIQSLNLKPARNQQCVAVPQMTTSVWFQKRALSKIQHYNKR